MRHHCGARAGRNRELSGCRCGGGTCQRANRLRVAIVLSRRHPFRVHAERAGLLRSALQVGERMTGRADTGVTVRDSKAEQDNNGDHFAHKHVFKVPQLTDSDAEFTLGD